MADTHEPDRHGSRLVARRGEGGDAVEVREDGAVRWLQFGAGAIQSLMSLREPDSLVLPYTRALLCWLLFRELPRDVLMLGLGGGSLVRWLLAAQPDVRIEAVDADARVVDLARTWFRLPARDRRVRVHVDDARRALDGLPGGRDLVVLDLFDADGMPDWLHEPDIHAACASHLAADGVYCANVWARDADEFLGLMRAIRAPFDGRVLCLPIEGYYNVAVIGFASPPAELALDALGRRAQVLSARHHVEFPRFLATMAAANLCHEGRLVL